MKDKSTNHHRYESTLKSSRYYWELHTPSGNHKPFQIITTDALIEGVLFRLKQHTE
jgi:hypothetical protein